MITAAEPGRAADPRPVAGSGLLLVATDGTLQSDAAVRMAYALARRRNAAVHVVAVVAAAAVSSPELGLMPPPLDLDDARAHEMLESVRRQVAGIAGDADWPIEVVHGHPPRTIVRLARERGASLIVLGLGRHRMLDRLIGSETAVQVLRLTTVPVLAVAPEANGLPRRAVAALDFSDLSMAAVRQAFGVLEGDATLQMVHVNTGTEDLLDGRPDSERLSHAWDEVVRHLDAPPGIQMRTLTLSGAPARELLAFGRAARADLLVAGTHGRGAVQRLVLGSVATQLLRGAECSVLVVPLGRAMLETPERPARPAVDARQFAERLERFTRRNQGRRCSLEVDDPDLGAQEQTLDYPFLGAAYDPRDRRVELMLGDGGRSGRHLTRSIGGVTAMDVLEDADGWDRVLRLRHGEGQTLLTFAR